MSHICQVFVTIYWTNICHYFNLLAIVYRNTHYNVLLNTHYRV